ncbi:uncharacterized protein LOC116351869, partial [Contarinia nasturtii]|uniref:uncharacterized protein LOC116351869 n=1 Tax=Contarinia nasturtii TaxID=265458 RepID=UPI0012D38EFE
VKLPCRAHGRPQPRIIWDRIGNTATQQLHNQQHQISSKINQYLERDTQEEALAKTKIMSLRSKRSYRMKRHKSIATGNQNKLHRTFNHEWHDNNQEITKDKSRRKKRESADNNERNGNVYDEDRSPTGAIPVLAFSTQAPQEVSQLKVTNGELILLNVTERDQGWYGCAAINEAGSVVKRIFIRVINGRDGNNNVPISLDGISSSDRFSNDQNILINTVLATSPNSLDISWDNNGIPSATALKLHYRIVGSNEFQTATAIIDAKEYTINDLQAYREYEVFASVPHGLSGLISNIRKGKTLDGPPSSAPTDIRVGIINITAAYVRWSPPPQNMLNGELIGYKIQIKSNVTNKLLGQMSLNATTQSVVINSLNPGGRYTARVAAQTAGGMGPYSTPAALHMDPSFISRPPKTDPAVAMWATTWMSGIALAILVITLISATIFALYWARKNKRNMKASYGPGILTANTLVDKQQTLWMHGNTLVKPIHSVAIQDANLSSEYAEVTQIMPKKNLPSVPPEPYATVTLQRGTQSDDSCIKCSTSPSSSEYNSPMIRESCDVLPLPPQPPSPLDHPYHPPNMSNMTIRTNPVAMSPICRRTATQSHWPTLPPPVPHLIWQQPQQQPSQLQPQHQSINDQQIIYKCNRKRSPEIEVEENDYESGSVLYEECDQNLATNFFNYGGEPTEEYYRNININMEFLNENELEQSNPCLDTMLKNRHKPRNDQSPVNSRRSGRKQSADSNQNSNDDDSTSESDNNRWPSRLRRSRSKSSDRKYRNGRTRRE